METAENLEIEVHLEQDGAPVTIAHEVEAGLTATPKQLPSKYFYDERGSRLFERITHLPEYYLTRTEEKLLDDRAEDIVRLSRPKEIVELGSGAARKIRLLLDAAIAGGTLERYVPVDVSQPVVELSAKLIADRYPGIDVHALVGDFEGHLDKVPDGGKRLVVFLGSTIGNFPRAEGVDFLGKITAMLDERDWFLLGTDLVKDRARLEAAYNDSEGVTAEFNLNILNVINRHLDGDFDPGSFEHLSYYNEKHERIESYLRSKTDQSVRLDDLDLDVTFAEGELLWTEVSCKYTRKSVEGMLEDAGMRLEHWFTDADENFALSLSRLIR